MLAKTILYLQEIEYVMADLDDIKSEVYGLKGGKKYKQYLKFKHQLTQKLLKLDSIDTSNLISASKVMFRTVRKSAIQKIQTVLSTLETKCL